MKRGIISFLIVSIFCSSLVFAATPFSSAVGYHPLQQVTTDQTGTTSVDANSNGVIDQADTATAIGDTTTVGNGLGNAILSLKGATTLWSAIDFYSGNTAYWGVGRNANDNKLYIDRFGVGRVITIDPTTLNVGIGTAAPQVRLHIAGGNPKATAAGYQNLAFIGSPDASNPLILSIDSGTSPIDTSRWMGLDVSENGLAPRNLILQSSGGNVGIGTRNPGTKLEIRNENTNEGDYVSMKFRSGASSNSEIRSVARSTDRSDLQFYTSSGGGAQTHVMTMQQGGNVGIGTVAPNTLLHLYKSTDSSTARDYLRMENYGYSNAYIGLQGYNFYINSAPNTAGGLVYNIATNNVGIGTTNPGAKLQVYGTLQLYEGSGGNSPALIFGSETGAPKKAIFQENYWMVYQGHDNEGHKFRSVDASGSYTDDMVIKGNGNVGIGTVSPGYKLDVRGAPTAGDSQAAFISNSGTSASYGGILALNTAGRGLYVNVADASGATGYYAHPGDATIGATANAKLHLRAGATDTGLTIDTAGNVGIGTVSPQYKFDVSGPIQSTGLTVSSGTVSLPVNQIDSTEVSFNYAASGTKGGAAANVACTNCIALGTETSGAYDNDPSNDITTGNIGSQSVNYASSSGNADTVDGYHASSFTRTTNTWTVDSNAGGGGWVLVTNSASPSCNYVANAYPRWRPNPGSYALCQTYMYRTNLNGATLYVMTNCGSTLDGAQIRVTELC